VKRRTLLAANAGVAYFAESRTMAPASYGLHLAVSFDGLNWTALNQNNRSPPLPHHAA
jgi:hypothetical protein